MPASRLANAPIGVSQQQTEVRELPRPSRWDDVVAAAAKVFDRKGFGGSSLEDIAQEVGMLKGSLYNYISTKEDLLFAVVRPAAEELLAKARSLRDVDLPPSEKIRQLATTHVEIIDRQLPYVSVYVREIAGRGISAEWSAMDREYVGHVEAILTEGRDQGHFDTSTNPHVAALSLIGALNWLTRWYRPAEFGSPRDVAGQISDVFLAGMLVRGSGPR